MKKALELSQITISNLRSIQKESFPLSHFTALIGYNNAGKTNILMGIRWLLSHFASDISYFDDPEKPVEVEGLFKGISKSILDRLEPEKRDALWPYLKDESLRVKKIQRIPGELKENLELLVYIDRPGQKEKGRWERPNFVFLETFEQLFPEPLTIWDYKGNQAVAKLLHEILKPLERRISYEFKDVIERFGDLLSSSSDLRAQELKIFDQDVNKKLNPLFPSIKVELDIPPPSLETFLQAASLKVIDEDDGFERDLKNMGAGSQRAIQMALVRYLAEIKKNHHNHFISRKLLLVDSPELFLHPQAVELVRVSLKKLSNEGFQVVFATHSAQMVTSEDVSTSLLIRKNRNRGTFMRKRMEDAVHQVIQGAPSQLQMLFSLSNSNELLFADYVLLTEGKTEWRLLPALFEKMTGQSFALIKCALVRQGGVSNTRKSMQVLSAMDMPVRAIVDLDYAFNHAVYDGFLEKNDPDLETCMNLFKELAFREKIRLVHGIPVTKNSRVPAAQAFVMMAAMREAKGALQNIHYKLQKKGIWIWTQGAIEEHLGLEGKNEQVWNRFIEGLKRDRLKKLPDYQGIRALCDWIIEGSMVNW